MINHAFTVVVSCHFWHGLSCSTNCARTLDGRLLYVIHHVVQSGQTSGIAGRIIGEMSLFLRDIVDLTYELDILLTKRRPSIEGWGFLFATLEKRGFDPSVILCVRLLYSRARCSILINGCLFPVFCPTRGVRQGCFCRPSCTYLPWRFQHESLDLSLIPNTIQRAKSIET